MSDASARVAGVATKACTFCRIVAGELPAHVVLDDEVTLAFLDTRPLFPGHTLIVPREHHETLADLPVEQVGPLFTRARRIAAAMEDGFGSAGSFVAMNNRISQSVPHLHVHVVPRNPKDGLRGFFWPRTKYADDDEAAGVAARLREVVDRTAMSS
jgi:histidine triad (HIT) family protein